MMNVMRDLVYRIMIRLIGKKNDLLYCIASRMFFCLLYCILLIIFSSIVLRLLFLSCCIVLYCIVPCRTELYVFIFYHHETNSHSLKLLIHYFIDTSILELLYSSSYLRQFKWFISLSQISPLFFLSLSLLLHFFFSFSKVLRSLNDRSIISSLFN